MNDRNNSNWQNPFLDLFKYYGVYDKHSSCRIGDVNIIINLDTISYRSCS